MCRILLTNYRIFLAHQPESNDIWVYLEEVTECSFIDIDVAFRVSFDVNACGNSLSFFFFSSPSLLRLRQSFSSSSFLSLFPLIASVASFVPCFLFSFLISFFVASASSLVCITSYQLGSADEVPSGGTSTGDHLHDRQDQPPFSTA